MRIDEVQSVHTALRKQLEDKVWVIAQDEQFIESLRVIERALQNMSAQIYVFVDLFEQYIRAVYQSPVFLPPAGEEKPENDEAYPAPTQTADTRDVGEQA
jgi:hypothetical protein